MTVSQDRLRALATQLSLAEERVRRSLASELHDYLGQMLVVCRLKFTQASQGTNEEREQQLRDADRILQDAITYTRSLGASCGSKSLPAMLKAQLFRVEQHSAQPSAVDFLFRESQYGPPDLSMHRGL